MIASSRRISIAGGFTNILNKKCFRMALPRNSAVSCFGVTFVFSNRVCDTLECECEYTLSHLGQGSRYDLRH